MAERTKNNDLAEKAYAAAAAEMKSAGKPGAKAAKAPKPVKADKAPAAKKAAVAKAAEPAPAPQKAAEPDNAVLQEEALALPSFKAKARPAASEAAPAATAPIKGPVSPVAPTPAVEPPVNAAPALTPVPTTTEPKDTIMASAPKNDNLNQINNTVTTAIGEIQTRAKAAYDKGTEAAGEVTEFAKGNVEAVVESSKIFAAGIQDLGRTYVEEARAAYETMSADVKELAAVKSPTELFQLQGKIVRRNFDAMVATSSKNTEALMKLTSDAFAPLSGRVNLAAEKLAKVA